LITSKERVENLRKQDPYMAATNIAVHTNISRQRVSQILIELGLPTTFKKETFCICGKKIPGVQKYCKACFSKTRLVDLICTTCGKTFRRSAKTHARRVHNTKRESLTKYVSDTVTKVFEDRRQEFGTDQMDNLERAAAMRAIDTHWMEHLDTMDYLRTGIGLRGYGQRDPLVEYQKEGYQLFQKLLETIKESIIEVVLRAKPAFAETENRAIPIEQREEGGKEGSALNELSSSATPNASQSSNNSTASPIKNEYKNVGRNDTCPCGSGKKFKKCHGE